MKTRFLIIFIISLFVQPIFGQKTVDAMLDYGGDLTYAFNGKNYVRYRKSTDAVDKGYPKSIQSNVDFNLPSDIKITAAFCDEYKQNWSKIYFFSGSQFYRYDKKTNKMDSGFPKMLYMDWKGMPNTPIDAAMSTQDGEIHFFSGDRYFCFDRNANKVKDGYPTKIVDKWKIPWSENLDAAVFYRNTNHVYFFKGDEYIRVNKQTKVMDKGYPKKIAPHWKNLENLAAKGWVIEDNDNLRSTASVDLKTFTILAKDEVSGDEPYTIMVGFRGVLGQESEVFLNPTHSPNMLRYNSTSDKKTDWEGDKTYYINDVEIPFKNLKNNEFFGVVTVVMEEDNNTNLHRIAYMKALKNALESELSRRTKGLSLSGNDENDVKNTMKTIDEFCREAATISKDVYEEQFKKSASSKVQDNDDYYQTLAFFSMQNKGMNAARLSGFAQTIQTPFFKSSGKIVLNDKRGLYKRRLGMFYDMRLELSIY